MPYVVLLGDSIFDNASYTDGQPDVIAQLQAAINPDWRASSCAVDGSMTQDIPAQIAQIPTDATHLVVSVGGNNAIDNADVLMLPVTSTAEAFLMLAERGDQFERNYRATIRMLLETRLKLTVCTIYNGNSSDPKYQRTVQTALMIFNDVILRTAFEFRLPITAFPRFLSHHPLRVRCPLHLRNAVFFYSHRSPCLWEGTPQTWETLY
jgi:hypothetical protein